MVVSPFICYDLRFPEAFRGAVRRGARAFVVIANWPAERHEHWDLLLRARAIENQAFVVGVNRCGSDPRHAYAGGSMIVDPQGGILARAGGEECVISADLDAASLMEYRERFPALGDMHGDLL
jgi:predicted amidohydrolase